MGREGGCENGDARGRERSPKLHSYIRTVNLQTTLDSHGGRGRGGIEVTILHGFVHIPTPVNFY